MRVSLLILLVLLVYGFIDFILKYRKWSLLGAGFLGLVLATNVLILINSSGSDSCTALYEIVTFIKGHQVLVSSITILALGLPTFFTLWLFRTHDTQENINNSTFFECARLLATKDSPEGSDKYPIEDSLPKEIALEQLAYLKRETSFDKKKIDLLTRNLFLIKKEFSYVQLSGIDLSGVNLQQAILVRADLTRAGLRLADLSRTNLSRANLSNADLSRANLSNADLTGADLSGAIFNRLESSVGYLRDADFDRAICKDGKPILEGAKYNSESISTGSIYIGKTVFPDWLDSKEKREEAKMRDVSTREEAPKNK